MTRYTMLILIFALAGGPVYANTIVVTSTDDAVGTTNGCILRDAINSANSDSAQGQCTAGNGADVIVFELKRSQYPATIALIDQLPGITSDLTIEGPGAEMLIIDGGGAGRILPIWYDGSVAISGLRFRHGNGDSIMNSFPPLPVRGYGGAIFIHTVGKVTLSKLIFDNNSAEIAGGAIMIVLGDVSIENSIFDNNAATHCWLSGGGAIAAIGEEIGLSIENSTFSSNFVGAPGQIITGNHGGAILVKPASQSGEPNVRILNSTFSGNRASGHGGAIAFWHEQVEAGSTSYSVNAELTSVTITGNTANSDSNQFGFGGGVYAIGSLTPRINNSIIAANEQPVAMGFQFPDVAGSVNSGGFNFIGVSSAGAGFGASDHTGTIAAPLNPRLLPLADNGGFGQTHLPHDSSQVIDQAATSLRQDQRGTSRPQNTPRTAPAGGNETDIGAVEVTRDELSER